MRHIISISPKNPESPADTSPCSRLEGFRNVPRVDFAKPTRLVARRHEWIMGM
jgi:hypothetical protein